MLLDAALYFSKDQALTTTADAAQSLDSEYANPDLGKGGKVGAMVVCKSNFTSGTNMRVDVYAGANAADTLVASSKVHPLAELVKGKRIFVPYPPEIGRYRKLTYTITGTMATATVDAYETVFQG